MRNLENFLISVEKKAFRMAQLATHCEADALDIVQDAMMKLAGKYSHKPEEEWRPLFYSILESRIMDWHRKQQLKKKIFFWRKEQAPETEDTAMETQSTQASPESELISEQLGERLLACVAELPVQQQQCFVLRAWEGLSVNETAQAMGINENSVKTHYARAVQKLKASHTSTQ